MGRSKVMQMADIKESLKEEKERRIKELRAETKRLAVENATLKTKLEKTETERDAALSAIPESKKIDEVHMALIQNGLLVHETIKLQERKEPETAASLPWKERKGLLNALKFPGPIKQVSSIVASSPAEVLQAARIVSKIPGSEGAMIKDQGASYPASAT